MTTIQQDYQKSVKKVLKPSSTINSISVLNGSKISKSNLFEKGSKGQSRPLKPTVSFKENEITQQLQRQIYIIEQCLKQHQPFVKHLKQREKKRSTKQQIFTIDSIIQLKDYQIKEINQEIKFLKNVNNNSNRNNSLNGKNINNKFASFKEDQNYAHSRDLNLLKCSSSNHQIQQNNIFKLAEQLKDHRQLLKKLQNQHKTKQLKFNQIKQLVVVMEQKFFQKCKKTKQRPLGYQQFKQLNEEKKRQIQQKTNKRLQQINSKHKQSFVKDFQTGYVQNLIRNQNKQTKFQKQSTAQIPLKNKKTLKQLQNRKIIAEQALKNARKKHNNQLNQLTAKIQFLRQEDTLLLQKIKQKQYQKGILQTKFQQKGGADRLSFRLNTQNRLVNQSNKSSRENIKSRQNKLFKSISTSGQYHSPIKNFHRKLISPTRGQLNLYNYNDIFGASERQMKNILAKQTQSIKKNRNYDDYQTFGNSEEFNNSQHKDLYQ